MKLLSIAILLSISYAAFSPALAEKTSGNKLYATCQNSKNTPVCLGYIAGVVDGYTWTIDKEDSCISKNLSSDAVTPEQVYDVVLKYLKDNPQKRNQRAAKLIMTSIHDAFGCSKLILPVKPE